MAQSAWCGGRSPTVGQARVVAWTAAPVATEFKVILDDTLGTLAQFGAALGDAGVNVEAIQGTTAQGKGVIQFVANDQAQAARALEAAHIAYTKREVIERLASDLSCQQPRDPSRSFLRWLSHHGGRN